MGNESGDTSNPSSGTNTGSGGRGWVPPSVEELHALIPQYEIESLIGHGGMGAVYRGMQPALKRPVAIKLLPETLAESNDEANFVERFKLEARAMASLDHPAIISVHDFGQTPAGHLYFVMEFIDGMDMHKYIQLSGGNVEPDTAVAIVSHVLDALDYAHSKAIVHRDIKPANVLINREGKVKIADFGLAKKLTGDDEPAVTGLTMSNVAMGTPDFIAPEALDSDAVADHRADLYAVGVMLYQMLTGKVPRGIFRLPSEENDEIDPRLDDILTLAMEPDPNGRFQSATEFRLKLDELASAPVQKIEPDLPSREIEAPAAKLDFTEPGLRKSKVAKRRPSAAKKKGGAGPIVWTVVGSLAVGSLLFWWIAGSGKEVDSTGLSVASDPVESVAIEAKAAVDEQTSPGGEWISLFNGRNLEGWKIARDTVPFSVEDGAIVADFSAINRRRNLAAFTNELYREEGYEDFELVYEAKEVGRVNGGMQIRSQIEKFTENNLLRIVGPQVEFDSAKQFSGYIWEEGSGRGWLNRVTADLAPHAHVVKEEYNEFRVVAEGPRIRTWVNGNLVEDLSVPSFGRGGDYRSGIVGLAVFGKADEMASDSKGYWKNIRIRRLKPGSVTDPGNFTEDWPTGPNFSQKGGFRAWCSIPNDPILDLSKLAGITDVKQVHVRGGNWIVLRENGQTVSSDGIAEMSDIVRICPGFWDWFALISNDGRLYMFNNKGPVDDVPSDLPEVADAYVAPFHRIALLKNGSTQVWGKAYDGEKSAANPEWKVRPELPEGRKAIAISSSDHSVVIQSEDGNLHVWRNAGPVTVPEELGIVGTGDISVHRNRLFVISPSDRRALSWDLLGREDTLQFPDGDGALQYVGSDSVGLVKVDGTVAVERWIVTNYPDIAEPLGLIRDATPGMLSLHMSIGKPLRGSILWFKPSLKVAIAPAASANVEPSRESGEVSGRVDGLVANGEWQDVLPSLANNPPYSIQQWTYENGTLTREASDAAISGEAALRAIKTEPLAQYEVRSSFTMSEGKAGPLLLLPNSGPNGFALFVTPVPNSETVNVGLHAGVKEKKVRPAGSSISYTPSSHPVGNEHEIRVKVDKLWVEVFFDEQRILRYHLEDLSRWEQPPWVRSRAADNNETQVLGVTVNGPVELSRRVDFHSFEIKIPGSESAPATAAPTSDRPLDIPELRARLSSHQDLRRTQLTALLGKYRPALARAQEAAIAAGELERVEAIQTAIRRADTYAASINELSEEKTVEALPPLPPLGEQAPPELKRLRSIFDTEVAKIESNLQAQFETSLETLQRDLVKKDRVEEARAVERYRVGLSAPPQSR